MKSEDHEENKMKKLGFVFSVLLLICIASPGATAATIELYDWAYNINGTVTSQPAFPAGVDPVTGLGTWTITFQPNLAGSYSVLSYFDFEIDQGLNTWFNERGTIAPPAAAGQSWEIDEPGYAGIMGDIWANFKDGVLDNTNAFAGQPDLRDDVAMALGWDFALTGTQKAVIDFRLATSPPGGPFYLIQSDDDSQASIFFSSSLSVQETGGENVIPEPGTVVLLLSGLGLIAVVRLRKSA